MNKNKTKWEILVVDPVLELLVIFEKKNKPDAIR